jgi:very-short-patch-repair endonuclease
MTLFYSAPEDGDAPTVVNPYRKEPVGASQERYPMIDSYQYRVPNPKKLSPGCEGFALHCRAEGIKIIAEFKFHPVRRWRVDFVILNEKAGIGKLAVEVEGGSWSRGRHTRGKGFEEDCRKYAEAALLGWTVLRFSTDMVQSGEAINFVLQILGRKPKGL